MAQHFRSQWVRRGERAEFSFLSRVPGLSDAHWTPTQLKKIQPKLYIWQRQIRATKEQIFF